MDKNDLHARIAIRRCTSPAAQLFMVRLFLLCATLACVISLPVQAQSFPNKAVRMVVPFAPGAGTDAIARILGARMAEGLGQQVVIDNRPGAGGSIGTDIVAKAAADGHTILFAPAAHAINPSIYPNLPFDTRQDFRVISVVASLPVVLVVEPGLGVDSVKALVSLARARPGKLSMGSAGNGTVFHLTGELFRFSSGVDLVHVPFKGGAPAMAALLGGQVNLLFETSLVVAPQVRAGKARALAVASEKRLAVLPDVPTLAEAGLSGLLAENWYAIHVPAATSPDAIGRIYGELTKALAHPDTREKLAAQGAEIRGWDPERSASFVDAEIAKWARVVKDSGAKID